MRLMSFHNRICFKGAKVGLAVGFSRRKGKKFDYNTGQSNIGGRYTGGTDGDPSDWALL